MRVGLDIGSTTIKCVVLNDADELVYSTYERHYSPILEKGREILARVEQSISTAKRRCLPSPAPPAWPGGQLQGALCAGGVRHPRGGQPPGPRHRLHHRAGRRGRQDPVFDKRHRGPHERQLRRRHRRFHRPDGHAAENVRRRDGQGGPDGATRTYTIASRCGVFAKSDIQPLINQGAQAGDISRSIYQAVVNQTIAGLAQGRPIQGNVLYLGGPLTFSGVLRQCFDETLHVKGTCPENSLLYVALGAAYYADEAFDLDEVAKRLDDYSATATYVSLPPLFASKQEYEEFHARHMKATVPCLPFGSDVGPVHIGIDSGSTTIKLVVIDDNKNILFTSYQPNLGNPIPLVRQVLTGLYEKHPGLKIASVTTTGYGEALVKNAFHADFSLVETVAHFTAAKYFMPNVDFIIDIGGQDMKCFKIEDGAISNIFLNEACSSGCGSFLQTFAEALGYDVKEFAALGLFADRPVDLGSRCTVFMNSSVKQAQKDGASIENISAGLSISVVKNALYKVIRAPAGELGRNIVVQGGTFYNEAVLRAFEKEMHVNVHPPRHRRPDGRLRRGPLRQEQDRRRHTSSVLTPEQLANFSQKVNTVQCSGCGNHCQLTINIFSDGKRFISGNRCEKPVTGKASDESLDLYAYKLALLLDYKPVPGKRGKKIGIPLCLNMYELLPFWHSFFTTLGYEVVVSPVSNRTIYQEGQATIPSDTACFPAKLAHGHIAELSKMGVGPDLLPLHDLQCGRGPGPEPLQLPGGRLLPGGLGRQLPRAGEDPLLLRVHRHRPAARISPPRCPNCWRSTCPASPRREVREAIDAAYAEYNRHMALVRQKGEQIIEKARAEHRRIIVLAGRPYHVDPEVNHGIDKLILQQGAAVVTEDSISDRVQPFKTTVLNQWTYHSGCTRRPSTAPPSRTWTWCSWCPSAAAWTPSPPTRPARSCRPAASCTPSSRSTRSPTWARSTSACAACLPRWTSAPARCKHCLRIT